MPTVTQKSDVEPLLKVKRIGHGTLGVVDLAATRRWYEEVLGFDVVQTSVRSMMIRKGTEHCYAVVEAPGDKSTMDILNHNGIDLGSREEVDRAYSALLEVQERYGIQRINKPTVNHGDYSFVLLDLDSNWWEFLAAGDGGYSQDFADPDRDMTGVEGLAGEFGPRSHTHDSDFRDKLRLQRN